MARGIQVLALIVITGWLLLVPCVAVAQDMALKDVLIEGEDWQLVGEGFAFTEGPAVDSNGNLYFTDVFRAKIYRLDAQGKPEMFVDQSYGTNGMMFGPDGRLYGCQNAKKRIVAYDSAGKDTAIAEDVNSNDIVVVRSGALYFTDPEHHQVWYVSPKGEKRVVDTGLGYPNGIRLWPDQGTLVVADMKGPNLWAYRVEANGDLKFKQPYYTMRLAPDKTDSAADGLTIDSAGRVYVATRLGLQMFDPTGRLCGVIASPQKAWLSNVVFAGPKLDTLYVTCSNKVYKRKVKATVFRYFDPAGK
ncbi:MAG: SMP-30/gluconolactonase/LRE family protein [Planctomycetia bacterium]|nr:SMP-30/gluconolactonase/LRE family protein [Planctomycetia bacterium]